MLAVEKLELLHCCSSRFPPRLSVLRSAIYSGETERRVQLHSNPTHSATVLLQEEHTSCRNKSHVR